MRRQHTFKALLWLAGSMAIGYIAILLILMFLRARYPYELEWIEGASVDEIRWILAQKPVYAEPSAAFLPLSYNPLYFFLAAGLSRVVGVGFFAPRLLSILSTLGGMLLLFRLVVEETKQPVAGLIAVGIYAASFRFAGAWMDLAKVDALFLFLLIAAFYCQQKGPALHWQIGAVLFWLLSYYTKQLTLPVAILLAGVSFLVSRGRTWLQWFTIFTLGILVFFAIDQATEGWFSFYTVENLGYHRWMADIWPFWQRLVAVLWPALLIGLAYLASLVYDRQPLSIKQYNLLAFSVVLIGASWSVFLKQWTYDNGFLPACLGIALLVGLGTGRVLGHLSESPWRLLAGFVFVALLFVQNTLLLYHPLQQLPTRENYLQTQEFVTFLHALPGKVWVLNHAYFGFLAGKETFLHSAPLGDVLGGELPPQDSDTFARREAVKRAFLDALQEQQVDWIISDKIDNASLLPYYLLVKVFDESEIFTPVTGAPSYPRTMLARNPVARGGDFPLDDGTYAPLFAAGWHEAADSVRWTSDSHAVVQIALERDYDYTLTLQVQPACLENQPLVQRIEVGWGENSLGEIDFATCLSVSHSFDLPAAWLAPGLNDLWLASSTPKLGVGLSALTFVQK